MFAFDHDWMPSIIFVAATLGALAFGLLIGSVLARRFNPKRGPEQLIWRYVRSSELQAVMRTACKIYQQVPTALPEGIIRSVVLPFGEERSQHLCLLATKVEHYEPLQQGNFSQSWTSREMLQDYLQKIFRTLLSDYEFRMDRSRHSPAPVQSQ